MLGSGGIAPPFLTSALDGREWSASLPYRLAPWGKSARCSLDRRLGGSQCRPGSCGEEKSTYTLYCCIELYSVLFLMNHVDRSIQEQNIGFEVLTAVDFQRRYVYPRRENCLEQNSFVLLHIVTPTFLHVV
jgi:hypothetical protein